MTDEHTKTVYFMTAPCTLGIVLVARSERGICAVFLGDNSQQLTIQLKQLYSKTNVINDELRLIKIITDIITLIDDPTHIFSFDIDMHGTAFQQQVWSTLQTIPIGNTISYKELALRIGKPNATRAVANACGANQIAILIPCHRVVRTDGTLSGYRWGQARKQALIEKEKHVAKV